MKIMKRIVVLSGAGMSAESGLSTFRDSGGLWEGYDVMEVASPQGWANKPELVLSFYNQRRAQLLTSKPNAAHQALAAFERESDIAMDIITQNVDDLHERAGSQNVLHLHGELLKARSSVDPELVYPWNKDIVLGDICDKGSQLRPHIVWFGEEVPMIPMAAERVGLADAMIIVGTSLQVYPAASLIDFLPSQAPVYYIDPAPSLGHAVNRTKNLTVVAQTATEGIPTVLQHIKKTASM